jgi:hypothetical protein
MRIIHLIGLSFPFDLNTPFYLYELQKSISYLPRGLKSRGMAREDKKTVRCRGDLLQRQRTYG